MQTNVLWKGLYYQSLENCRIVASGEKIEITSVIVGECEGQLCRVDYRILADKNWTLNAADIDVQLNNNRTKTTLELNDGQCFINEVNNTSFEWFRFIDISLTPFTNTLPINSLHMQIGERQMIEVIYFDILAQQVSPVKQFYTRLSERKYLFETYDKSFSAEMDIDEYGLVTFYPQLFEMVGKSQGNLQ